MKKLTVGLLFFGISALCFSQDYIGKNIIECISYLSKPVPKNYIRGDRTTYLNEERSIILKVNNGIVIGGSIGNAFDRTNEALEWQSQFYDYFESNNWVYSSLSEKGIEIYVKNNIYALIISPTKRADNQIVAMIILIEDLNNLSLMN